jgi:TonB family protein
LGAVFKQFTLTNNFVSSSVLTVPEPILKLPTVSFVNSTPVQSSVRVEGALATRKLLSPLATRPWPRSDLLTNSIVQLVVDREGHPVSVPILLTSSGDKEADEHALEQARGARFEASSENQTVKPPLPELTWGRLIFDWAIVPVSSTNAPVAAPMP